MSVQLANGRLLSAPAHSLSSAACGSGAVERVGGDVDDAGRRVGTGTPAAIRLIWRRSSLILMLLLPSLLQMQRFGMQLLLLLMIGTTPTEGAVRWLQQPVAVGLRRRLLLLLHPSLRHLCIVVVRLDDRVDGGFIVISRRRCLVRRLVRLLVPWRPRDCLLLLLLLWWLRLRFPFHGTEERHEDTIVATVAVLVLLLLLIKGGVSWRGRSVVPRAVKGHRLVGNERTRGGNDGCITVGWHEGDMLVVGGSLADAWGSLARGG